MAKFTTTNSNLFNNNNKEYIPDWMKNITDNLSVEQKQSLDIDFEKRGVFAENQKVYREEITADPRDLKNHYGESKLLSDSKIMLAKFLSGKYYKIVNENLGLDSITLDVKIDGIPATFNFPYEVKASKLRQSDVFYADGYEYPFSKAGLNECLVDIKSGNVKTASKPEAVGKVYVISREEIIRRFNGSLRQATDKINQFLNEGAIVGAGSNSYASYMDVDQLFPQLEKQVAEEKLPEFHFAPNSEHVKAQEFKSASVLSVEAANILNKNFKDFTILSSERNNDKLTVKASVLGDSGVRYNSDFIFNIENEKVKSALEVKNNKSSIEFNQFVKIANSINDEALNKYHLTNKVNNKIRKGSVLTKKDIESKLFKIVSASKIDDVINNWIDNGLIKPLNSYSYATDYSFEEILNLSKLAIMSDDDVQEIEQYEKHFGNGIEIDTDNEKPQNIVREIEENCDDNTRLFNANSYISKLLKQYKVASFNKISDNQYNLNIEFLNKKTGTRHKVHFEINFEGSKVASCYANINGKKVSLNKLADSFNNSKLLSAYVQDKKGLMAGPIVISKKEMKKQLSTIISSSKLDEVISSFVKNKLASVINGDIITSDKSLTELIATIPDDYMISEDEKNEIEYRKRHFGKEIKMNVDSKIEDTGIREAEESWSPERKAVEAKRQLSKLFKSIKVTNIEENQSKYKVEASFINPIGGSELSLMFSFDIEDNKLGKLSSVIDKDGQEFEISKINEVLSKNSSEVGKFFSSQNGVFEGKSNVMISKANLTNKLKAVVSSSKVDNIINKMIESNAIQPINSVTFASEYTVSELVNKFASYMNLDEGKEEFSRSIRNDHKLSLDGKYVMDNDSRKLQATIRELSPQMILVKEKLIKSINDAANSKKITSKKQNLFIQALENAKTIQDLEAISVQFNQYIK
jgi:hypothetical protein